MLFKLKKQTHKDKATQKTEDSRKVLDLNAENNLLLVQSSQFIPSYHYIYFLIKKKIKTVEITLRIPRGTTHTAKAGLLLVASVC